MRYIQKGSPPYSLLHWKTQRNPQNEGLIDNYEELRRDQNVLNELKTSLLREQGYLCAYTGRKISDSDFHIEHIIAQSHCANGEDTDYHNLLVCFPKPNTSCEYGAIEKKDWPSPSQRNLFISPIMSICKDSFDFQTDGEIIPIGQYQDAAKETISRLNLNHPKLKDFRKEQIDSFLFDDPLSKEDLRNLLKGLQDAEAKIYDGATDQLTPFCFVFSKIIEKLLSLSQ